MRPLHAVLFLLAGLTPFFGCTYKAEPANGKQTCADGLKACPDGYVCGLGNLCYQIGAPQNGNPGGSLAGINGAGGFVGGGGGGGAIGISAAGGTATKIGTGGIGAAGGVVTTLGTGGTTFRTSLVRLDGSVGGSGGSSGKKVDAGGVSHVATFQNGQASGPITGYGWISLGALDRLTDPTCGTYRTPITNTTPCLDMTNWNPPTALCISATIPALPTQPLVSDYDNNWGIEIGVNATTVPGESIGRAYSTIAVSLSGSPTAGLRVELHRAGDLDTTTYCANSTGAPIPLIYFNTACWDNSGTAFTAASAPLIDKIGVQVSSTQAAITVTNLCLNSITFGD